jgi:hypothetical protein
MDRTRPLSPQHPTRPCPRCKCRVSTGDHAVQHIEPAPGWRVMCGQCEWPGPWAHNLTEAVAFWNALAEIPWGNQGSGAEAGPKPEHPHWKKGVNY